MTLAATIRGLYAVLDRDDLALARSLVGRDGAKAAVLQVRLKSMARATSTRDLLRIAGLARALTREHGVPLIINDRRDVALAVGADGVHLGQDDLPLAEARRIANGAGRAQRFVIGVSTHDLAQVTAAVAGGADYLGCGPVFATATKANPDPVQGVDALAAAVRAAGRVPVVAIGGVTPDRCPALAAAGAAAACCIAAVNNAPDPVLAGRAVAAAWP